MNRHLSGVREQATQRSVGKSSLGVRKEDRPSAPGKGGGENRAEDNGEPAPTPPPRPPCSSHLYLVKTGHLWGSGHLWQAPCWGVQVSLRQSENFRDREMCA